jgi:inositol transport system substrate-binding protein
MKRLVSIVLALVLVLSLAIPTLAEEKTVKKIAFCFQDLETEFWVAGYKAITTTLRGQGIEVLEYNGNEDANKQLEQVNDAVAQDVDGIIIIPQDGESAVTIVKTANKADVPVAVFNRPPSIQSVKAIVVVADNYAIAYDAAKYMFDQARERFNKTGEKVTAMHMIGDLGDPNAVQRANGFKKAAEENQDIVENIVEVPTKWDANTALANLKSATQANPNFNMLFCGSDFLYPQIQSVLEPLGKWVKVGDANHVIMGAVDGDSTAGKLMDEGFVDATAVQDLYFEASATMDALTAAIKAGETQPSNWIYDPGFTLTQANMAEKHDDMWGNKK